MSIIKKVDGEKKVFAENNIIVDHNHLANREAYGAHPISAIRKLPEKLNALKEKDSELVSQIEATNNRITNITNSNVSKEDIDKLQGNIDKVEDNTKKITLKENGDDTLTFTNYDGSTTNVRSGHKVDEDTITLNDQKIAIKKIYVEESFQGDGTSTNPISLKLDDRTLTRNDDNELTTVGLYDDSKESKILVANDIHSQFKKVDDTFNQVNIEIEKVKDKTIADYDLLDNANKVQDDKLRDLFSRTKGIGGYLNAYDFGKAEPTQDELTAYALTQIDSEDRGKIFNQTKVKNLFDDNIWILTNTPDSTPIVFDWANVGKESVADANNDGLHGLVTGSNQQYECSVSALGTLSVNGLPELEQVISDNFDEINRNVGDMTDIQQTLGEGSTSITNIIDVLKEHNQRILSEFDQVNEITGELTDLKEANKKLNKADEDLNKTIQDVIDNKVQIAQNYREMGWDTDSEGNHINVKYISKYSQAGANDANCGMGAITIGAHSVAGQVGISIGHNINQSGNSDILIGDEVKRTNDNLAFASGIAIGSYASVGAYQSVAIGTRAVSNANEAIQLGRGTNTEVGTLKVKDFTLLSNEGKIPNERLNFDIDNFVDKTTDQTVGGSKTFTNFNLQVSGNRPIQMQAVENGDLLLQQSNTTLGTSVSIKSSTVNDVQSLTLASQKGNSASRLDITNSGFIFDVSDIKNDVEELTSIDLSSSSIEVISPTFLYNGAQVATVDDIVDVGFLTEHPLNISTGVTRTFDLDNTNLNANIQEILKYVNNQNGGSLISVSFKTSNDNITGDVVTIVEQGQGNVPELDTDYGQPILSANSFYYLYPEQIFVNGTTYTICFGCKTNYPYGKGIVTLTATKNITTGLFENATATLAGEAFYVYNGIVNRYYFQDVDILNETLTHLTIKYTYYPDF